MSPEQRAAAISALVAAEDIVPLDNAAATATLNAPDPTLDLIRGDIPTSAVKNVLRRSGEWGALVLATRQVPALGSPEQQLVAAAITVEDTLTNTTTLGTSQDEDWAAMQLMAGALVQGGIIAQATAEAMLALPFRRPSRAEQAGLGTVTEHEVFLARGGPRVVQEV